MKTITKEYIVYDYAELSSEAKEKVKDWYLDGQAELTYIFTDDCLENLKSLFPNSDLKVEYSLCYCQGDGFNIYGKIYLDEVLEHIKDNFTEKELKFFKWLFNYHGSTYDMPSNRHYSYCICDRHDFMEDYLYDLQYNYFANIPIKTMEKFNDLVGKFLCELCRIYEKDGYSFFYEISEEDLSDICEANQWNFTADGKFFFA